MKLYHRFSCLIILLLAAASAANAGVTVLHSFATLNNGTNQDGANSAGGLVLSGNVLCGSVSQRRFKSGRSIIFHRSRCQ